jgi:hypothetical protein
LPPPATAHSTAADAGFGSTRSADERAELVHVVHVEHGPHISRTQARPRGRSFTSFTRPRQPHISRRSDSTPGAGWTTRAIARTVARGRSGLGASDAACLESDMAPSMQRSRSGARLARGWGCPGRALRCGRSSRKPRKHKLRARAGSPGGAARSTRLRQQSAPFFDTKRSTRARAR